MTAETVILYIQDINPIPWMAPDISVGRGKGGRAFPTATTPAVMRAYQNAIRECFTEAYPDHVPFPKGTELYTTFMFWRKLDQYYGPSGRAVTAHRADATNCTKSTEDALQKPKKDAAGSYLYHNDVDNVWSAGYMIEQGIDVEPAILIAVSTIPQAWVTDRHSIMSTVNSILAKTMPPSPPGNVRLVRV